VTHIHPTQHCPAMQRRTCFGCGSRDLQTRAMNEIGGEFQHAGDCGVVMRLRVEGGGRMSKPKLEFALNLRTLSRCCRAMTAKRTALWLVPMYLQDGRESARMCAGSGLRKYYKKSAAAATWLRGGSRAVL
jgi:hypothetical protein